MSFYTIQSPGNRNEEVKKYLELKNYLRNRDRAEQMGELARVDELSKIFKPVSSPLSSLTQEIKGLPAAIAEASPVVPALPAAPKLPAIEGEKGKIGIPGDPELSDFMEYIKNNKSKNHKILLDFNKGKLDIGGKPLKIDKKNISYERKTYKRTPELLDLIFNENPNEESRDNEKARDDYEKIIIDSGVLPDPGGKKGPDRRIQNLKEKWEILGPIYHKTKKTKGKGLLGRDKWSRPPPELQNGNGNKKNGFSFIGSGCIGRSLSFVVWKCRSRKHGAKK